MFPFSFLSMAFELSKWSITDFKVYLTSTVIHFFTGELSFTNLHVIYLISSIFFVKSQLRGMARVSSLSRFLDFKFLSRKLAFIQFFINLYFIIIDPGTFFWRNFQHWFSVDFSLSETIKAGKRRGNDELFLFELFPL